MQIAKASTILDDAYRLIGWDPDQLDDRHQADARSALSQALQEVWEAWWWSELMRCEQTELEETYDAATVYAAGAFVYFPATRQYYEKTKPSRAGTAPATVVAGAYETQVEYWQEVVFRFTADDYDATEDYEPGDLVRDPDTDTYYSRYQSVRVSGGGSGPNVAGFYLLAGAANGKNYYAQYTGKPPTVAKEIIWTGSEWQINVGGVTKFTASDDVDTPQEVDVWTAQVGGATNPSVNEWEGDFPEEENWGALSVWTPDFTGIHWPRLVSVRDPRLGPNCGPYAFEKTTDGTRIVGLRAPLTGIPWVWYRRNTPILTGDEFDPAATYEATDENDLVFDS